MLAFFFYRERGSALLSLVDLEVELCVSKTWSLRPLVPSESRANIDEEAWAKCCALVRHYNFIHLLDMHKKSGHHMFSLMFKCEKKKKIRGNRTHFYTHAPVSEESIRCTDAGWTCGHF